MTITKTMLAGLGIAALMAAAPAYAQNAEVEAPIKAFIDNFNKGDVAAAMATHLKTGAVIIDEFAPFMWSGPKSFEGWGTDFETDAKAKGVADPAMSLGAPTREVLSGDHAYVIVPSVYTFKQKGVAMSEAGQMTFAMVKTDAGWKIAGWTWTGPEPTAVR